MAAGGEPNRTIRLWLIASWLVTLIMATAYCSSQNDRQASQHAPPSGKMATVTVTVTVTEQKIPEVCYRAIELMQSIIADTRTLNSKADVQVDIATAANRAIFEKDWSALNEVQERQRRLMHDQSDANHHFMSRYDETLKALDDCKKAAGK